MVIMIGGASHAGKTALAQKLMEKYHYPYLFIDYLKMGLIRSGHTDLMPLSSTGELTAYLWPIVREMIRTVIENDQNLIVEGCYLPFDWKKDFEEEYIDKIRCIHLVMSEQYIRSHFDEILGFANVIEHRLDDSDCTMESVLKEDAYERSMCRKYGIDYVYIDSEYNLDII